MNKEMSQAEIRAAIARGNARMSGAQQSRKAKYDPEEQLQRDCHSWNEAHITTYPLLEWMFHTPNGGKRTASEGGRLKAMGVKAGVPDLMLPFPSDYYAGVAIELKSPTGQLTDNQRKWLRRAAVSGWVVGVARTLEEHIDLWNEFMTAKGTCHHGHAEIFQENS